MSTSRTIRPAVGLGGPVAALLAGALAVIGALYLTYGSFTAFMLRLDPVSALGPCRGVNSVKLGCDFENHYYPQGLRLSESPTAVPGFFYSGFFALGMWALAHLPHDAAKATWEILVVGAEGVLLVAPLLLGMTHNLVACLAYGVVLASALPVLHDFAYGQVSSLLMALTIASFVAYDRGRRYPSAALLGAAAAIKLYPALFAVHYLLRRDFRAFGAFAAATGVLVVGVPVLALGPGASVALHESIFANIEHVAGYISRTPYSSFVANAVTYAADGAIDPGSWLYRSALGFGIAVALFHLYLARGALRSARDAPFAPLMLGVVTIPFVVRPSWVHYSVCLPLLQLHVFGLPSRETTTTMVTVASRAGAALSAFLIGPPLFFLVSNPDDYYRSAMPFWATAVLLPALYLHYLQVAREPELAAAGGATGATEADVQS